MTEWTPILESGASPLYERLLAAMRRDIEGGDLPGGTKLPPQRQLAERLGLSLGTVTRAYSEAERLGIITSRVGSGSYVTGTDKTINDWLYADIADANPAAINLASNFVPVAPIHAHLSALTAGLRGEALWAPLMDYAPVFGAEPHRAAVARWLIRHASIAEDQARRVILSGGGQHGVTLSLEAVAKRGEVILCEELTYFLVKSLAEHRGYRLSPVRMDHQGLMPDDLEAAIHRTGARVLYTLPTLHNPTARTMPLARRRAIIDIARKHRLWIIEDDAYGYFARNHPDYMPLAALAPELVFYVSGMSKVLAPGLRVGFLVPPSGGQFDEAISRALKATLVTLSGFGPAIVARAIETGLADTIASAVEVDARARMAIADRILGHVIERPSVGAGLHVWLPLSELAAERVAGRALRAGVDVTPPSVPLIGQGPYGLRLCLGATKDHAQLEQGLNVIAQALLTGDDKSVRAIV